MASSCCALKYWSFMSGCLTLNTLPELDFQVFFISHKVIYEKNHVQNTLSNETEEVFSFTFT